MAFTKLRRGFVNLLQQLEFCLVSLALSAYWKTFTQKYGFLSEKVCGAWRFLQKRDKEIELFLAAWQ